MFNLIFRSSRTGSCVWLGWLTVLVLAGILAAGDGRAAPDELLVRFKAGTPAAAAQRAFDEIGAYRTDRIPEIRVEVIKLPAGLHPAAALARLKANPAVERAEANQLRYAAGLPDDPELDRQWGLDRIGAKLAWERTVTGAEGSPSIIIAILDTGIDPNHNDTADSKLVPGYNALNPSGNTIDDHGHGTYVAGIASAITNNNKGIAGVAWQSRLMPIKVLDENAQGTVAALIKGLVWAANNGAKVMNMSLSSCPWDCGQPEGDCGDPSSFEAETIETVYEQGCVLVGAAGNSCTDQHSYPAAYPYVIGVSATADEFDTIAYFSNYGDYIDLAAPGVNIFSLDISGLDSYIYDGGTSAAAPHVAGLAAVLFAADPAPTNEEVVGIMQRTADQPSGGGAWNPVYGYGRINMYRALTGSVAPAPGGEDLAYVYPNPFSPDIDRFTTFVIFAAAGEPVSVEIYDLLGNRVWETSFSAPADLYFNSPVRWHGKDESGRELANGIYFAHIKAGQSRTIEKIAIVR